MFWNIWLISNEYWMWVWGAMIHLMRLHSHLQSIGDYFSIWTQMNESLAILRSFWMEKRCGRCNCHLWSRRIEDTLHKANSWRLGINQLKCLFTKTIGSFYLISQYLKSIRPDFHPKKDNHSHLHFVTVFKMNTSNFIAVYLFPF